MADFAHMFEALVQWLVALVEQLGVLGIFIMTFVESTFVPIPCEMVMIPAGYLIQQGKLPLVLVLPASIFGTIGGAYFNYLLARHLGRALFMRYGKYFLMTPEKMTKLERFFHHHGAISTFLGRLIPGVRHYISFPAGLAQMHRGKFLAYTALGGGLWMSVLLALGYFIGANQALIAEYVPLIKAGVCGFIIVIAAGYVLRVRRKARQA